MCPEERLRRRAEAAIGCGNARALDSLGLLNQTNGAIGEAPSVTLWRSVCAFIEKDVCGRRRASLDALVAHGGFSLLPTPEDIASILRTILASVPANSISSGPTLTTASCDAERACLNVVERRWTSGGRLMAKA